jgi:F-type H+-transporting ATPase subunit epsilon
VPLQVELVSADQRVWSGEASIVVARTVEGDVGIMPGHAPVLSLLSAGDIKIESTSGETVHATVDGGFLSVEHDRVTVVSDRAGIATGSSAS